MACALAHHRAGRLRQAEKHYRRIIERVPDDPVAGFFMAVVARQRDQPAASNAAVDTPGPAEAFVNQGNALLKQGRAVAASTCYRQALALRPELAGAHCGLGNALQHLGRWDEAISHYQQALALQWDLSAAHNNLGSALRRQGRPDEAIACYRRALALSPNLVAAYNNLGNTYGEQERWTEAVACYERAVQLQPQFAEAHNNLGNAYKARGQWDAAAKSYRRALATEPRLAAAHNNLGTVFHALHRTDEAIACYRRAIALQPDFAEAHNNLGNALRERGNKSDSIACYQRAIALAPDLAAAHNNLGNAYKDQGQLREATECFRKAITLQPDFLVAHSNLLMTMQYDPEVTPDQLYRAHREVGRRLGQPSAVPHRNHPDPDRQIRVGYVSPNLGQHPVGFFLKPLLPAHDRREVEVICYSDRHISDKMTAQLRAASDAWHETASLGDAELEQRIRADGIDILVDLAGHTADNRLAVFARKPSPVQVTWAGYVGTTGLPAIDYVISDERETPTGTDHLYVETVVRLPDAYVCFAPPDEAPPVTIPPARQHGCITFGCFNNLTKVTLEALTLWGRLLDRLPGSRLILKTHALDDPAVRRRYEVLATTAGIDLDRIDLRSRSPQKELLAAYGEIDIALDPFPYSGGLTTLESLWMGVPVVTLGGDRFASRHTLSHLTAAGLPELIAAGRDHYIEIAAALAEDLHRLERLRRDLRPRLAASPLCDGRRFAGNLEAAYRAMWQRWCRQTAER